MAWYRHGLLPSNFSRCGERAMAGMPLSSWGYYAPLHLEHMRLVITSWPMAGSTNGRTASRN